MPTQKSQAKAWLFFTPATVLEGGKWGLENVPKEYFDFINQALDAYTSARVMKLNEKEALAYAEYMIVSILAR